MALKGVNLGGWLVVEKWMTPSLFEGSKARNEYELAHNKAGQERLLKHHAQFITEDDIVWLKRQGIELVRVPVGHWVFGDVSPYKGAIDRLDWLMEVARKHDIKVLISLHGAPGAQNAEAHSGSGNWPNRSTAWLDNADAQSETIAILVRLAKRYGKNEWLWGIELLNEPVVDTFGSKLVHFYRKAAYALHPLLHKKARMVFSDGFHPFLLTGALWPLKLKRRSVVLDIHMYYCFGKKPTAKIAMKRVRTSVWMLRFLRLFQPVMIGEWSGMLGRKVSRETTEQFIGLQEAAYEGSVAQCYWSYKTEADGRWNFQDMTEKRLYLAGTNR